MARIEMHGVTRSSGGTRILDDVNMWADDGEFVTVIGHSGAGKSSVLRAIAGLDPLESGTVRFDGDDVTTTAPADRDIGLVSQHNTLFPTHRVRKNLLFPLRSRGVGGAEARKRVQAESRAQHIEHILDRWPASLSGGEQRLAEIARALVRTPRVFLMDEPLANLDVPIRRRLCREIVELQKGYGVTMVYASNRAEEILTMPDRLVALERGRVIQMGPPADVRDRPATLAIAELTGPISRLAVTVEPDNDGYWITGEDVRLRAWDQLLASVVGERLTLAARPANVTLMSTGPITATVGGRTIVESQPARVLTCGSGSMHTLDKAVPNEGRVNVTLDNWLLYDSNNHLLLSYPRR